MGDSLKADLKLIRNCSSELKKIQKEFENNGNPADDYMDDLGYDELKEAFQEFSDTWDDAREKVCKDLKNLAKYTKTAADKYDEVDSKLADALRKAKEKGK